MIGGIVGGIVALLIIVGLIAFFVVRNRRAKKSHLDGGHSLQPQPTPILNPPLTNNNAYDRVPPLAYDHVPPIPIPSHQHVAHEYNDLHDVRQN